MPTVLMLSVVTHTTFTTLMLNAVIRTTLMLNAVMLTILMLSVVMLTTLMLNVVAPTLTFKGPTDLRGPIFPSLRWPQL